jgi:hypothetical protein
MALLADRQSQIAGNTRRAKLIGKRAVLSASSLALALVATVPAVAFAGTNDNNNASVGGVSASSPTDCPAGYFCVYTGPNYTGKMFKLYNCKEYNLYGWNGRGSYENNNNPPVDAVLQDVHYQQITRVRAKEAQRSPFDRYYDASYDFRPVWHIKPC